MDFRRKLSTKLGVVVVFVFAGLLIFQAQTFYGKRRTGFYKTQEDGASFGYYVPRNLDEKAQYPLVVVFGKKATDVMKWKNVANDKGLVVVSIQPKEGGRWNYSWDGDRTLDKVKQVMGRYPIDNGKIWAMGSEQGGAFALMMTINYPDVFNRAAAINSKTYNALFRLGKSDDISREADVFDYNRDSDRQRPLWMLNFSESEYVPKEDLKETGKILKKFGYSVTTQLIEGEPFSPTSKMIEEIYQWFNE